MMHCYFLFFCLCNGRIKLAPNECTWNFISECILTCSACRLRDDGGRRKKREDDINNNKIIIINKIVVLLLVIYRYLDGGRRKEEQKNEERMMAQAAFGEFAKVVNVVTGEVL